MDYGANILSKQPSDWTTVRGEVTSTNISLEAGGYAKTEIVPSALKNIPETLLLTVICNVYSDNYSPAYTCTLTIVTAEGPVQSYTVPLVQTSKGLCRVVLPTTKTSYKKCFLSFAATYPVVLNDWSLSAPVEDEVTVDLDAVKEEIPKLLYDYNSATFTVGQREETIALISARLLENTDVNGHLQLTYVASEDCVITIRAKDNNGTELFAPILYNVKSGRGSIGVPHAYLKRLLGIHTFSVTAQCTTGTLTMYTRGIMYTIDAGHLAKRTMDVGLDVQDIAVQQLPGESTPSSILAIGIDTDGIARVRHRTYSENAAIVWEPSFSLGEATIAAIEFDGDFVRHTGNEFYTLECYEQPYAFWVDPNTDLYCQLGADESTRLVLSTGVTSLSAVRGYKSQLFPEQDQGVIVAYVVDGAVKYRSYSRSADGVYRWDYERTIEQLGTDNVTVHVHRLNDYRVGFVATGASDTKWLLSKRTYVNAAFPAEQVSLSIDAVSNIAVFTIAESQYTNPVVTTSYSDDKKFLYVDSDKELIMRGTFYESFTYTSTHPISIKTVTSTGTRITIELNEPVKAAMITLKPIIDMVVVRYPNGGYVRYTDSIIVQVVSEHAFNESVHVDLELITSINTKAILTTESTIQETCTLDLGISSSLTQKLVTRVPNSLEEQCNIDVRLTSITLTQLYVGTSPV